MSLLEYIKTNPKEFGLVFAGSAVCAYILYRVLWNFLEGEGGGGGPGFH